MTRTLLGLVAVALVAACRQAPAAPAGAPDPAAASARPGAAADPASDRFPDFGFLPPRGSSANAYNGPLFVLSQDYPAALPPASARPAFIGREFRKDWRNYMLAVRDYCFEGNVDADFRVENNKVRRWYHIPWQHYGPSGREGVHGLTKEAPVQPRQLAATQTYTGGQTYAVGIFNEFGGYTVGQVWKDRQNPDLGPTTAPNGFPEGTVVCKPLFVDVPPEQVPSLVNPMQWDAYITDSYPSQNRSMRKVALIQMDIAVKDLAAPLGWIFGTFQYNGAMNRPNKWENLVPLGLMWGNDPEITDSAYTNPTPTVTRINPNLKETVINPDTNELPPTHLGWNGRLNGPVDNPKSSCLSCHMTAELPSLSALAPSFLPQPPAEGSPEWMRWFQNGKCGVPFDQGAESADFSLQLSIGIANMHTWRDTKDGFDASKYPPPAPVHAALLRSVPPGANIPSPGDRPVYPIARDLPLVPKQ